MIRGATTRDGAAIAAIYNPFVIETVITFETLPVEAKAMGARIERASAHYPWLVLEQEGSIRAYAYATEWRSRPAYKDTVETTIYVDGAHQGRGLGRRLYGELIARLSSSGVHCALGGIALPNPGSIALHEALGFRKVAQFEEVGRKLERWVDVGFWQLML